MSQQPTQVPSRTTMFAFAATVVIGGMNVVAVKFSNSELPPLYGAGLRFGLAAVILLVVAKLGRMELPRGTALLGTALYGVLNFSVGYALIYVALLGISAGAAATILACVPLITLVMAVIHRQERVTVRGVIGGLFAVAGIAVMSFRGLGTELPIISLLAAVGAAFAFAESSVVVKGFPQSHPITTNAVGMAVGGVVLFLGSAVSGETWIVPQEARTWLVLVWLIVGGSVGLFGLFVFVIKRWTASATAYALTLMPVVSVTLGALLAGETVTPEVVAGGALVLFGVYAGALSARRSRDHRDEVRPVTVEEEAFAR